MRAGGTVFDAEITRLLLGKRQAVTERLANDRLSERERDVLLLIAEGRSNRSIAGRLGVSEGTVEKHCSKIFSKFHLEPNLDDHRRVLLVLHFLAHG